MRKTVVVEPTSVVEASGFDNERVTLPSADGISKPGGICICRMAAAVSENLPVMIGYLKKNDGESGSLNQFERLKHRDEHRIEPSRSLLHFHRSFFQLFFHWGIDDGSWTRHRYLSRRGFESRENVVYASIPTTTLLRRAVLHRFQYRRVRTWGRS